MKTSSTKTPVAKVSGLPKSRAKIAEQLKCRSGLKPATPPPDFPTQLRYEVELVRHFQQIAEDDSAYDDAFQEARRQFFSADRWPALRQFLQQHTGENGHFRHSVFWKILFEELRTAAALQTRLKEEDKKLDPFQAYAAIYDAVIGRPCMDNFMKAYIRHFGKQIGGLSAKKILSLGCGTGIVEQFLLEKLDAQEENLLGIDISAGMIREARKRIPARQQDLLTIDTEAEQWDLVYSGLNVFHYLPFGKLETAIQKTAALLEKGGYFLGDFITPDHIRWYPNVIASQDNRVISLRNPELIEVEGAMFQESEIFNLHRQDGELLIHYAGKHRRFLPPMHRVRSYFEKYYREVRLFEAFSLQELPEQADTCASTRYVVLARK